ncbi:MULTISPECIES: DUF4350 domain-containing protein [Brevibacillus]|uniref:DUF4350 domain-containing protein n=1 Tax=Brevibacillus TaxID=55080 RepID=UPI000D0F99B6|nr:MULTISPECIES: DUF4350 domain-containing protein [Brevibacillus]MED1947522.1 DUF4350 domain-containing protein [Brevibacillus formosus]MED1997211.1 DUF4350 domain-containing protein [Brevibacillus formosus]MED2083068.1 DUF4350 domain-containing protein [Brevibacillus formosus]PSK20102.1 DUF4350 domain-containing protein [Brevibacillus sp. NRRL NRS-603]
MDSLRTYRVGIAVATLLLVIVGWLIVKPTAEPLPPYLASSAQPSGIKAVLVLLEEKGKQVKEWRQPMRFLPTATGQAMLVVEPERLMPEEQIDILDWVSEGNDLILFHSRPEWEDLPFHTKYIRDKENQERNIQGPLVQGRFMGKAETSLRFVEDDDMEPLLYDDQGILGGRTEVGDGSVTFFLVPEWLTNQKIDRLSHFEAIWPHVQGDWSVLWVDEYHHGLLEKPGFLAIYPGWLIAACMQLGILLLLYVWWRGKRFGPVYTLREWTVRRGDETLLAVSSWYERRGLAKDALRHREAYMRQLLYDRWGVHQRADRVEIVRYAKTRWTNQEVEKFAHLLERLEQAKSEGRYSPKSLLADSLLLDEITKRLEKE